MNAKQRRGTKAMVEMYLRWRKDGVRPDERCPLCKEFNSTSENRCEACPNGSDFYCLETISVWEGPSEARWLAHNAKKTLAWRELPKEVRDYCNLRLALHRRRLREDAKRRRGA